MKLLLLVDLGPVILLRRAPVLPRGQPQLQSYPGTEWQSWRRTSKEGVTCVPVLSPSLNVRSLRPRFQLVPAVETGGWDVLERNVHAPEEVVLRPGAGALSDLLEKPAQAFHAADLVQAGNRVQHRRFVVVVPETDNLRTRSPRTTGTDLPRHTYHMSKCRISLDMSSMSLEEKKRTASINSPP